MSDEPKKPTDRFPALSQGENRTRDGRFVAGHTIKSPGRPPMPTLRSIAEARAPNEGMDVDDVLWAVFKALAAKAATGDTVAAKLLLDHCAAREPDRTGAASQRALTLEELIIESARSDDGGA